MIKSLLIDLDDTLLRNDMSDFLPAYLSKLGNYVAHLFDSSHFIEHLMEGTNRMLANLDPRKTLEECFSDYFYSALDTPEDVLRPQLENFYHSVFPSLRSQTSVKKQAPAFLQRAVDRGLEIIVATNPLFPLLAVVERLRWAEVPPDQIRYTDITGYECYHFAKPRPEFFAEILGRHGRQPHEAVMIGNDVENDLLPAKELGIAVFHVHEGQESAFPGGSFAEAELWLDQAHRETNREAVRSPTAIQARLRGNLAALLSLTRNLEQDLWSHRPAPQDWSPKEIICHLRDVEIEVTQPRVKLVLEEDTPFISAVDVDPWAEARRYYDQSGPGALETLIEARRLLLQGMEHLDSAAWERPARHALLGPTTLAELISVATDHEILHLAQLREALPGCSNLPGLTLYA